MDDLEKQTESILKKEGWDVLWGGYYRDTATGKPREKDIIATRFRLENNDIIKYGVRLFIECKNLPQETEIYLRDSETNKVENFISTCNIPYDVISELERHEKLHLCNYKNIFRVKDSKDFLYAAINQNLQSFAAFRKNLSEREVYYLIIVFNGKIFFKNENDKIYLENALLKIETIDKIFDLLDQKCFIELISITQFKKILNDIMLDIGEIDGSLSFYYRMDKNKIEENRRKNLEDKMGSHGL